MATDKKKPASAKSNSGSTAPSAGALSSTSPSSAGGGGGGAAGGASKKKPPPSAAAAPTAVAAAPSGKTKTTAKKDNASSSPSSPPPDDDDNERVMTRCTEKDVLLGRGKRVSEWPGNIHFRQVVNRYREEYATAERANKVKIAAAVIAAVQNVGGRFVREAGRSWYVVSHDRAVEKTCQALREKEKANPPNVSPFVGGDDFDDDDYDAVGSPLRQKRSRLSPTGSPSDGGGSAPRTKRKILHQSPSAKNSDETSSEDGGNKKKRHRHADNSDEETSSDNDDDSSSSDSDDDDNESSTTSEEDMEEEVKHSNAARPSPAAAAAAATAAASVQAAKQIKVNKPSAFLLSSKGGSGAASMTASSPSTREDVALVMMNRLRAFWSTHGHAAVPPIWPRDQKLADWCIQQRQLHREVIRHQKMAENGASEQNGTTVDKGDDSAAVAAEETEQPAPTTATANTANAQQQVEPYRRCSPAEARRIDALNRLGFCWDYAAWHWEHQYQLLVAQVATKQDERPPASLNKATEKERQDSSDADAMEVDGAPFNKDDTEQMDVDKESTTIINGNANKTEAKPENGNAIEVEQNDDDKKASSSENIKEGTKGAPTDETQVSAGAASARRNQGVRDGILCTVLNDETLEWIDDQQDQYHHQGHHLVSKERRDKLEALGIYF